MKKAIYLFIIILLIFNINNLYSQNKKPIISFGVGYGNSFGGFGGMIQFNSAANISFHCGVGYFPALSDYDFTKGAILAAAGIKIFPPLETDPIYLYVDFMFGGLGIEATAEWEYIWGEYSESSEQKTLWGPTIMFGGEMHFGTIGIVGGLGLSYNLTKVDWIDQEIFIGLDAGLQFHF